MPAAATFTRMSPSPTAGTSTSRTSMPGACLTFMTAFTMGASIVHPVACGPCVAPRAPE
jgi:hypothetical protein